MKVNEIQAAVWASFEPATLPKPMRPVVICCDGKAMKLSSGKAVWKTAGHAKAALRNHLSSYLWQSKWKWENRKEIEDQVMRWLLTPGRLEIKYADELK
jgi:hypothetical protein